MYERLRRLFTNVRITKMQRRIDALRLKDLQHRESLRQLNAAHARTLRTLQKYRDGRLTADKKPATRNTLWSGVI